MRIFRRSTPHRIAVLPASFVQPAFQRRYPEAHRQPRDRMRPLARREFARARRAVRPSAAARPTAGPPRQNAGEPSARGGIDDRLSSRYALPSSWCVRTVERVSLPGDLLLLRAGSLRQIACKIPRPVVIGTRKRNSDISCCSIAPAKDLSSEAGRSVVARRRREPAVSAPERTHREHRAPPVAPAQHRAPAHADQFLQALHSLQGSGRSASPRSAPPSRRSTPCGPGSAATRASRVCGNRPSHSTD